jgi:hypothetical protein
VAPGATLWYRFRMRALVVAVALAAACAGAHPPAGPVPPGREEAAARAALGRFAEALEAGRWPEAYALLSARWRSAYTPTRLALDARGAGPVGREATERVRALLAAGTPLAGEGGRRTLPVGSGRAAVLLLEEDGWRVDALE